MKGLEVIKNGGEPLRIGADDGLLLVMFNHVDNVSLKSIAADGTIYIWFYRELALGDKLTICFNEFPTASFTDPVVRSL